MTSDDAQCVSGTDRYRIGDALAELASLPSESTAVVCLDDETTLVDVAADGGRSLGTDGDRDD